MTTRPPVPVLPIMAALLCAALALTMGCDQDESTSTDGGASAPAARPQVSPVPDGNGSAHAVPPGDHAGEAGPVGPATEEAIGSVGPASTATAKRQAAQVTPFLPLADAVLGEWASYAALDGWTLHYEITEVSTTAISTRVVVHERGNSLSQNPETRPAGSRSHTASGTGSKPVGLPAIRKDRRDADLLAAQAAATGADRRETRTTIEAAGRRRDATCYEDQWTDEEISYVRRTWVSPEVPVFGTIRMELYGDGLLEARLELMAAGGPSGNVGR